METTAADPVIAEVRRVRDGLAESAGYDVEALFRRIRELQDASGRDYVSYPPRRVVEGSDESLVD